MPEPREGKFNRSQEGAVPEGRYVIPAAITAWVADYVQRRDATPDKVEYRKINEEFERLAKENLEYELALYRLEHPDWAQYEDRGPHEYDLLQRQQQHERQRAEEEAERTPVNPENNIVTHYEETLDRMAKIEGDGWKMRQGDVAVQRSVAHAHHIIAEGSTNAVVYGDGGYNRWFVRADGSVEFSAGHVIDSTDHLVTAKKLGFKIYGEIKKE